MSLEYATEHGTATASADYDTLGADCGTGRRRGGSEIRTRDRGLGSRGSGGRWPRWTLNTTVLVEGPAARRKRPGGALVCFVVPDREVLGRRGAVAWVPAFIHLAEIREGRLCGVVGGGVGLFDVALVDQLSDMSLLRCLEFAGLKGTATIHGFRPDAGPGRRVTGG